MHNIIGSGLDETGRQHKFTQKKGYTIPYGCFVPKKVDGLLFAGRNISGTHNSIYVAEKIKEFGADIIIDRHQHIIQKCDISDDYTKIYCLGNFFYDNRIVGEERYTEVQGVYEL